VPSVQAAPHGVARPKARQLDLDADELGPLRLPVIVQPIRVHQPDHVIVGVVEYRLQEGYIFGHRPSSPERLTRWAIAAAPTSRPSASYHSNTRFTSAIPRTPRPNELGTDCGMSATAKNDAAEAVWESTFGVFAARLSLPQPHESLRH
jgi:hypothetical protein